MDNNTQDSSGEKPCTSDEKKTVEEKQIAVNKSDINEEASENIQDIRACRGVSFELSKDGPNQTFSSERHNEPSSETDTLSTDIDSSQVTSDISIASSVAYGMRIIKSSEMAAIYAKNAVLEGDEPTFMGAKIGAKQDLGYFSGPENKSMPEDMLKIIESHPYRAKHINCMEKLILKSLPPVYFKKLNTLTEKEIFQEIIPIKPKMKQQQAQLPDNSTDETSTPKFEDVNLSDQASKAALQPCDICFSEFSNNGADNDKSKACGQDPASRIVNGREASEQDEVSIEPDILENAPVFIPSGVVGGVAANMSFHGSFIGSDDRRSFDRKTSRNSIDECEISDVIANGTNEEDTSLNVSLDKEEEQELRLNDDSSKKESLSVATNEASSNNINNDKRNTLINNNCHDQENLSKRIKNEDGKKKNKEGCKKKKADLEAAKYDDEEYIMFGYRSVLRSLLTISVSTAISELVKSLYTFLDGIFVATVGSYALSALSNITHIEALWQVLGAWLAVGANATISSLVAKHRYSLAEFVISSVFIYSILIGAIIAGIVIPYREDIILWILGEGKPEILVEASKYIMPLAACSVFLVLYLAFGGVAQGLGYAKMYFVVSITCVILNCGVFNPLLILGCKWGVVGAAWGTVFSQTIGVLMYFGFFIWLNKKKTALVKFRPFIMFYFKRYVTKKGEELPVKEKIAKNLQPTSEKGKMQKKKLTKLERKTEKAMLTKVDTRCSISGNLISVGAIDGIASASAVAVTAIATIFVNKIALKQKEMELTITTMWSACLRIASLATSIMIGFSQAQLSLSSYAWSSRRYSRLIEIFKKTAIVMVVSSLIITAIIESLADVIPYMFTIEESKETFFKYTPNALRIFSATIFISGAQYVCCTHCQAVNLVNRGLWIAIFTQLVFGPTFFIMIYYITEAVGIKDVVTQYYLCLISYNLNDICSVITGVVFLTKPLKHLSRLSKWQNNIIELIRLKMIHDKEQQVKIRRNLNNSILNTFSNPNIAKLL